MTLLPVVGRELIVAARNKQIYRSRFFAALAAALAMVWLLIIGAAGQGFATQGKLLFQFLANTTFWFCAAAGCFAADVVSIEKREGTLGLLFLTSLRGHDVILGKLAAHAMGAFYGVLGLLPVLTVALLLGGVQIVDVVRVGMVWFNMLFLSLSCGVMASTLSRDARRATFSALGLVALIVLGPFLLAEAFTTSQSWVFMGLSAEFLVFSPLRALMVALEAANSTATANTFYSDEFRATLALPHVFAWTLIGFSCLLIPRLARDRPASRWRLALQRLADAWSYGAGRARLERRASLLDANPFLWLAGRHRRRGQYVWFFLASMAVIWVWAFFNFRSFVYSWNVAFGLLFLVHAGLKVWWGTEGCLRLGEDRRSGALELILTTPLDTHQVLRGHWLAMRGMFLGPGLALLVAEMIMLWIAIDSPEHRSSDTPLVFAAWMGGIGLLLLDAWALRWMGLWSAMTERTSQAAINRTLMTVLALPGTVTFAGMTVALYLRIALADDGWIPAVMLGTWLGVGLIADLWFGLKSKRRFLAHFRTIASEGFHKELLQPARRSHLAGKRTRPHVRKRLLAGAIAALLITVGGHRAWWRWKIQRAFDEMRARGQPTTLAEWERLATRFSPSSNAAPLLIAAAEAHQSLPRNTRQRYQREEEPVRDQPLSEERRAQLQAYLQTNEKTLDLLFQAANRPEVWLKSDPNSPDPFNTPLGFRVWELPNVLNRASAVQMDEMDLGASASTLRTAFRLGELFAKAPVVGASALARTTLNLALASMERMLTLHAPDASILSQLENAVPEFPAASLAAGALTMENVRMVNFWRNPQAAVAALWVPGRIPGAQGVEEILSGIGSLTGLRERDFLKHLQNLRHAIDAANKPWPRPLEAQLGAMPDSPWFPWGRWLAGMGPSAIRDNAALVARLRSARMALAVERFRLQHQRLPESLSDLPTPTDPETLIDPYTEGRLIYERLSPGPGYIVRSAGFQSESESKRPPQSQQFRDMGLPIEFRVTR